MRTSAVQELLARVSTGDVDLVQELLGSYSPRDPNVSLTVYVTPQPASLSQLRLSWHVVKEVLHPSIGLGGDGRVQELLAIPPS